MEKLTQVFTIRKDQTKLLNVLSNSNISWYWICIENTDTDTDTV